MFATSRRRTWLKVKITKSHLQVNVDKYVLVAQKFHVHLLRRVALGDGGHATMLRLNGSSWLLRPVVYVQNQVRLPCDIYEQFSSAV